MVLEKGDSGVCLSTTEEPGANLTEGGGVAAGSIAFFVDVGVATTGNAGQFFVDCYSLYKFC